MLSSLSPLLPVLRVSLASLAALIPSHQYYRYNDSFSRSLQQASFVIVISRFLDTDEVASKQDVEEALGSELARETKG